MLPEQCLKKLNNTNVHFIFKVSSQNHRFNKVKKTLPKLQTRQSDINPIDYNMSVNMKNLTKIYLALFKTYETRKTNKLATECLQCMTYRMYSKYDG